MNLHLEVLDPPRQQLFLDLGIFSGKFYVAGGTALALQIGHRESIDFDLFSSDNFDINTLLAKLTAHFSNHRIIVTQSAPNTLSVLIDNSISLSFLGGYNYPLVGTNIQTDSTPLASIEDIGCMKLSAIISRSEFKDYVDLYYILQNVKLKKLLVLAKQKFHNIDANVFLKALVYFADITDDPIIFRPGFNAPRAKVEDFLLTTVENYQSSR